LNTATESPLVTVERLLRATNDHDVEGIVSCFASDYVNETPAHPQRGFRGTEQVRRNWTQILASVPDLVARVPRTAVDADTIWTEWEMSGTRIDGGSFEMRGVMIFGVADDAIGWARFFLEPVEGASGDADAAVLRLVGDATRPTVLS